MNILKTNLCLLSVSVFTSGAPVMGNLNIFSCSAWRSWSRVCSLWCCGWQIPSNCCTSSSMKSLSCCPGGRNRRMKVDETKTRCDLNVITAVMLLDLQCVVCVFKMCLFVVRSVGLRDVVDSDSLWGSHDSPGGSHHVYLPAVCLLSNKGWLPHINTLSPYTHTHSHSDMFHILLTCKIWLSFTCEAGNWTV